MPALGLVRRASVYSSNEGALLSGKSKIQDPRMGESCREKILRTDGCKGLARGKLVP